MAKRKEDPLQAEDAHDKLELMPLGAGNEVGRSCVFMSYKGKNVLVRAITCWHRWAALLWSPAFFPSPSPPLNPLPPHPIPFHRTQPSSHCQFDCGIHPAYSGIAGLPFFDEIDPSCIDVLLVTHFHLDHAASLPYFLSKTNFQGRVFMTHATKAVYRLLLSDFVRVSKVAVDDALFTEQDIQQSMEKIEVIDFHQIHEVNGIKFWCYTAGHVLGAAMFAVDIAGIRVLYTGDYSREEDRHLRAAEVPPFSPDLCGQQGKEEDRHLRAAEVPPFSPDLCVIESTFGVQVRFDEIRMLLRGSCRKEEDRHLRAAEVPPFSLDLCIIESTFGVQMSLGGSFFVCRITSHGRTVLNGGRVLIPAFALGRAQELLLILDEPSTHLLVSPALFPSFSPSLFLSFSLSLLLSFSPSLFLSFSLSLLLSFSPSLFLSFSLSLLLSFSPSLFLSFSLSLLLSFSPSLFLSFSLSLLLSFSPSLFLSFSLSLLSFSPSLFSPSLLSSLLLSFSPSLFLSFSLSLLLSFSPSLFLSFSLSLLLSFSPSLFLSFSLSLLLSFSPSLFLSFSLSPHSTTDPRATGSEGASISRLCRGNGVERREGAHPGVRPGASAGAAAHSGRALEGPSGGAARAAALCVAPRKENYGRVSSGLVLRPKVQHVPLLYASPLACKTMVVYCTYLSAMNDRIREQAEVSNPFDFRFIKSLRSIAEFEDTGPAVVMASPGGLQSGLSRQLFDMWCQDASPGGLQSGLSRQLLDMRCQDARNRCLIPGYVVEGTLAKTILSKPNEVTLQSSATVPLSFLLFPPTRYRSPRNTCLIPGYVVEGTLAKTILSEPNEVTLQSGATVPLRMKVHYVSFAAHADYPQTSHFLEQIRPPHIVLVHGEAHEMARLKAKLALHFKDSPAPPSIHTPKNCQGVEFFFKGEKIAKVVGRIAEKGGVMAPDGEEDGEGGGGDAAAAGTGAGDSGGGGAAPAIKAAEVTGGLVASSNPSSKAGATQATTGAGAAGGGATGGGAMAGCATEAAEPTGGAAAGRTISGLLVRKGFNYQLLDPQDLPSYTSLGLGTVVQRQSVPFIGPFEPIIRRLEMLFDSVVLIKDAGVPAVQVHEKVIVAREGEDRVVLQWASEPVGDMLADSIVALILQLESGRQTGKDLTLLMSAGGGRGGRGVKVEGGGREGGEKVVKGEELDDKTGALVVGESDKKRKEKGEEGGGGKEEIQEEGKEEAKSKAIAKGEEGQGDGEGEGEGEEGGKWRWLREDEMKHLERVLESMFGGVRRVGEEGLRVSVDGVEVSVRVGEEGGEVECVEEGLRKRVREAVNRFLAAVRPIPSPVGSGVGLKKS
ncbi:unnamed protein product [Closterium sp. NIES-64]|nr:unnamed protein product [Closterium sp. NIES-64]